MNSAWSQQNQHCWSISAVSEQTQSVGDGQLDLESATSRPAIYMCVCVLWLDEHTRLLKGGTMQNIRTKPSNLLATTNNQLGTCTLIPAFAMLISQRDICDCVLLWGTALLSCSWETKKKKIAIVCQFGVNFDLLQISADGSNHYITHRVQHWFPWSHTWIEGTASGWVTTESYQVLFVDLVCGKKRVLVVKWGSKITNQSTCNLERPVLLLFAFHSKSLFANMVSRDDDLLSCGQMYFWKDEFSNASWVFTSSV